MHWDRLHGIPEELFHLADFYKHVGFLRHKMILSSTIMIRGSAPRQWGDPLFRQAKSHNRVSALAALLLCFCDQLLLKIIWIGDHLAGGNLLFCCAVITKFADAQSVFRSGT